MRRFALPLFLTLVAAQTSGCRVIETRRPIAVTGEIHVGRPARAWEVLSGTGELAGLVVLFEEAANRDSLYIVRNIWHQDLGLVDAFGRAYRYLPHHKEAAWVGSGSVTQGVGRILRLDKCDLIEVPFFESHSADTPGKRERRRIDHPESLTPDS